MASFARCEDDPSKFFEQNGYYYEEDETIGTLVPHLEKLGIAESPDGLNTAKPLLLKTNARSILEPYLRSPDIQLCITIGSDPGHLFIFSLQPGQKEYIILHLWSPKSEVELCHNSHLDPPGLPPLKAAHASNGLLEPPRAALKKRGYCPVSVNMEHGGLTITDRRFWFGVLKGSTATFDLRKNIVKVELTSTVRINAQTEV